MVTIWPANERSLPISITTKPVTQTAEVDEKSASTNLIFPLAPERGSCKRTVPTRMRVAKLKMKVRGGVKCRERKALVTARMWRLGKKINPCTCLAGHYFPSERVSQEKLLFMGLFHLPAARDRGQILTYNLCLTRAIPPC